MARKTAALRPIMTRIPEGLRRRLEREAELNDRSMNREIIARLEESFRRQEAAAVLRTVIEPLAELRAKVSHMDRLLLELIDEEKQREAEKAQQALEPPEPPADKPPSPEER